MDEFKHVEAKVQTWNEHFYDTGKTEGIVEGEAKVVLRLLDRKFGPLDDSALTRIRSATADQLLEWADRVLRADRLEEVFGRA